MKSCLHCSKPLVRRQDHYCSLKCSAASRDKRKLLQCSSCKKSILCRIRKGYKFRYCSMKCVGISKRNRELTQCGSCGRDLLRFPSRLKINKFNYCSSKCSIKGQVIKGWSKKYDSCIQCGTTERKHTAKGLCGPCEGRQKVLSQYNMTISDYNKQLDKQEKQCAICGCEANKRRLGVDHDHATGKVRELLCNNCNAALGNVNDNTILLYKMIQYLEKHSAMPHDADMIQPPR